jgi:hypothetical protein
MTYEDCIEKILADQETSRQEKQQEKQQSTTNVNNNNNVIDEQELKSKILNDNFFEFLVKTIKKTVRCEDSLIRQIAYTGLSSYIEDNPINLGILAPTSEGKTYPITESLQYFPNEDVLYIGKMSTMTLVRKKGILIDKNGQSIEDKLKELVKRKNLTNDREEKISINEEIQNLLEDAKTLIDLRGKILVFLEPPKYDLWDLLKPILSHDKKEIEFPFVNKTDREGHQTKDVVVRGWPSCIFCSARDESKMEIWSEVKSRFLITSPNMVPKKYDESTQLISLNFGWPNSIQQQAIISDIEMDWAKECILLIKQKISELKSKNKDNGKISLWIPYNRLLQKELPSNKGTDVRLQKRIFSLLNIVPIVKFNLRKLLVLGNETSVIADLSDLKEVLTITQNFDGIPKFKLDFFDNIFYPCFKTKTKPDTNADGSKTEDREAVTSKQLCDYYKEKTGKPISTDNIKTTYLNELVNNGLIDYEISNIHGKQYIYYPLIESSSFSSITNPIDQVSQQFSTIYEKIITNITETWLFYEIMQVLSHRLDLSEIKEPLADYLDNHDKFQFFDNSGFVSNKPTNLFQEEGCCCNNKKNNTDGRLTIRQFIQKYTNKSPTAIDEKRSPIMTPFGRINPFSSIQTKIDDKDEKEKEV